MDFNYCLTSFSTFQPLAYLYTTMRRILVIFISILICASSCKKEEDTQAPLISVSSPDEGLAIVLPESLTVTATISDDKNLDFVRYGLVDEHLIPAGETYTIDAQSNPFSFSRSFEVNSLDIETGPHYLRVLANDGVNDSKAFIDLNVTGIPREFLGVVYERASGSMNEVWMTRVSGETQMMSHEVEGAISVSQSGRENAVFVLSDEDNSLRAYSLSSGEILWEQLDLSPSTRTMVRNLYSEEGRRVMCMTSEPSVISYSVAGTLLSEVQLPDNLTVKDFIVDGSYFWVISETAAGSRLSQIFKSSGFEVDSYFLAYDPKFLVKIGEEILIVDEDSDLHSVNTIQGGEIDIPSPNTEDFHSVISTGSEVYLATSTSIFRYIPSQFQAQNIYSSSGIGGLSYDPIEQRLIVSENGLLKFFGTSPWQPLGSLPAQPGASGLESVFNK